MARMARVVVPNYPHHVTQRGNRRQKTFFCEDDYQYYVDLVSEYSRLKGEDDALVRVRPMLDRVDGWSAYLSDAVKPDKEELIERHARTGRPLGSPDFVRKLEIITGEDLAPKRPGRKPATV